VASLTYLDTHAVAWLYAYARDAVPQRAAEQIEIAPELRISPMVRLELQYLFEIERLAEPPLPVLDALAATLGLTVCQVSFPAVAREAESQGWTRDPFDRLIVAQAALLEAPLVTKDTAIHQHYPHAIWS